MPLHAEPARGRRTRRAFEWMLRGALLIALLAAIRIAIASMSERPSLGARGGDAALRESLRDWSTVSDPREVHLHFDSAASPATLAWAAALPGAGTRVAWSSSLTPIGVSVEPIVDPKGTSRVWIASPARSRIALADSLGAMDSVTVRASGASVGPVQLRGSLRGSLGRTVATAVQSDSFLVRPVLVLGRAGWEGKFVVASLEEYGWRVNSRLNVSPGNDVIHGSPGIAIDTSHYSAVIVLDSSAVRFIPEIVFFVRSGGGLLAMGEGASIGALRGILPATMGGRIPAAELIAARPRSSLALRPLVGLRTDAVALEKRGSRVAIAARRVGDGRVVQVGYEDTWRWRMSGGGDPVEEYRDWISSVVSSAAYAPRARPSTPAISESAPLAAIFSVLGSPSEAAAAVTGGAIEKLLLALFVIAIGALTLETASRRLDGKP
jgi:hypothetical protein